MRAELFYKLLTSNELLLSLAMLENSGGTGEFIWPSIERLAAYTKLDPRTVQRLIHGYMDGRDGNRRKGFRERGVLIELAPPNGAKHTTATYRFNLEALHDDPLMRRYPRPWVQTILPGIRRPVINGEPIPGDTVSPDPRHSAALPVTPCRPPGDTVPPNSKAFDSLSDSKSLILTEKLQERLEKEKQSNLEAAIKGGFEITPTGCKRRGVS
jgi:hypothetical protein